MARLVLVEKGSVDPKYINDCEPCRRNMHQLSKTPRLLKLLETPDQWWREIAMDFITDLLNTARGYNAIWSSWIDLRNAPISVKSVKTENQTRLFMKHNWKQPGMPVSIVSDRDTEFISTTFRHLFDPVDSKINVIESKSVGRRNARTEHMKSILHVSCVWKESTYLSKYGL